MRDSEQSAAGEDTLPADAAPPPQNGGTPPEQAGAPSRVPQRRKGDTRKNTVQSTRNAASPPAAKKEPKKEPKPPQEPQFSGDTPLLREIVPSGAINPSGDVATVDLKQPVKTIRPQIIDVDVEMLPPERPHDGSNPHREKRHDQVTSRILKWDIFIFVLILMLVAAALYTKDAWFLGPIAGILPFYFRALSLGVGTGRGEKEKPAPRKRRGK